MKELKAPDKIVQGMTRDGAVEVNKATGGAERISGRELDVSPDTNSAELLTGAVDRVLSERRALKKRAVKKANAKIYKRVNRSPEISHLRFSDAERTDPGMSKVIRKSDKAADRFEKARVRVPKEKVLSIERVSDNPAGRSKTRLTFRERDKPPNGKLQHTLDRPKREAALALHGEVDRSNADGNTGVQAAHFAERRAEGAARKIHAGYKYMKFRPYRAAAKAEEKAFKANVNALYERSIRLNPELEHANPVKKAWHKRKIKRDYAKSFRQNNLDRVRQTAQKAKKAAQKAKETAEKVAKFAIRHWKGLLIFGGALLVLIMLVAGLGSCASMFGGGFNAVIGTSYTAEDEDILGADADYTALESQLAARIANIESEYGGYDEYRYNLDEIGHDPFELASYLTAKFNMYTREQVQAELAALFAQQYVLTLTPVTEVRYRTETSTYTDPETGESYTETYEVPYNYYILYVTLTNRSLGNAALNNLTPEQAEMYAVYMETKGNKPELFGDNPYASRSEYTDYDVPPDALTDSTFAAMLQEAEKYLGYPYVWGGSSPSTSFDCSGYVSWVINHSGWSVGRLGANGLFNVCTPVSPADAKPGDLVFFWKTYDAPDPNGATHVGIYVGGGYMIHCGNPIGYADITTSYWVNHFFSFGRLP